MDDAKIYGLCLQRLKHQVGHARKNYGGDRGGKILLESYCTADPEDIRDILELYDLHESSPAGLAEKLGDLAYTVTVLLQETFEFGYDGAGNLGLYVVLEDVSEAVGAVRAA